MLSKLIAWLIELLRPKPKKQRRLEEKRSKLEDKLQEIADEENSLDDINDHFNK